MSTKERLAQRLHEIGLFDLAIRARSGEFSDFESNHAMPKSELVNNLQQLCQHLSINWEKKVQMLISEVVNGKWDDTREEAEEWAKSVGIGNRLK